jgi:type III secretory pathway lipoprotein EscJ
MSSAVNRAKKHLIDSIIAGRRNAENAKYGAFIVQTNEVQLKLALAVLQRSGLPDKDYVEKLERAELGPLLGLWKACVKTISPAAVTLIKDLGTYKSYRNRLAHKMFKGERLTPTECEEAIKLGESILRRLNQLVGIYKNAKPKVQTEWEKGKRI